MYTDYKALSVAPGVFNTLSWTAIILGGISCAAALIGAGLPEIPRWTGLVTLTIGVFYFFIFRVAAEGINLLREIADKIK